MKRFRTAQIAGVAALVAGVLVVVLAQSAPGEPEPPAQPEPEVGFNLHSFTQATPQPVVARELDRVRAAGGGVARVNVPWSFLEPDRDDSFNERWVNQLDMIVREARGRDIELLLVVGGTPCWASSAPRGLFGRCREGFAQYPPRDFAEYGEVVAWLTNRYGEDLAGIEVLNEANKTLLSQDPAGDYVKLVTAAHSARTNEVPIVAGALHSDGELEFMKRLYDLGIAGQYEIWSTHVYAGDDAQAVVERMEEERGVQLAHGDTTPVWVDEFGASTCIEALLGGGCPDPVTPQRQADVLPAIFAALGSLRYVEGALSYELRDSGTTRAEIEDNFGILRRDFSPKPAFRTVGTCLRDLASCRS